MHRQLKAHIVSHMETFFLISSRSVIFSTERIASLWNLQLQKVRAVKSHRWYTTLDSSAVWKEELIHLFKIPFSQKVKYSFNITKHLGIEPRR